MLKRILFGFTARAVMSIGSGSVLAAKPPSGSRTGTGRVFVPNPVADLGVGTFSFRESLTDQKDAEWIAQLLQYGLLRPSYVPCEIIRDLRDLTRMRASLSQEASRISSRIQKVLEDANVKLASVATNVLGKSAAVRGEALGVEQRQQFAQHRRHSASREEILHQIFSRRPHVGEYRHLPRQLIEFFHIDRNAGALGHRCPLDDGGGRAGLAVTGSRVAGSVCVSCHSRNFSWFAA